MTTRLRQALYGLLMLALLVGIGPASGTPVAVAQTARSSGIVCTTNPSATFTLTTRTGYINLPDGNTLYMWGYSEGNKPFQHPGPVLCVNEGDTVTIVLHNTLPEDVSIIFPGQSNVLANGAPAQPQFDAGGHLVSLTNVAAKNNGSVTYSFVADQPGTYLYMSGTNPQIQVQMGLFGALVVRPAMGANYAYNRAETEFNPDFEYIVLLSEIDPLLHLAVEAGQTYDVTQYRARYFMINGRSFPDTIAPNYASWVPNQPYSALVRIRPRDPVDNPLPALVRYLGVGPEIYPFHPHGNNGEIIARDGRVLAGPAAEDTSFEKFSIPVGPGQTWDALVWWEDRDHYDPVLNPVPVTPPNEQNAAFGPWYSGSPYLGRQEALPPGTITYNQCGEYYFMAHNHNLAQLVAWGVVNSGQITWTRIDPPLPNTCP